MGWEERAKKLEKKKHRMAVHGRGLITIDPHAVNKRLKRLKNRPNRKSPRPAKR
ncbi:MAG: hypothetical protein AB7J35_21775 [Dehalococcoidia bacterium]